MIGRNNSAQASAYAAKRAAALERANALRAARNRDEESSLRRAHSPISSPSARNQVIRHESSRDRREASADTTGGVYQNGIAGSDIRIETYGNVAERIIVRNSNADSRIKSDLKFDRSKKSAMNQIKERESCAPQRRTRGDFSCPPVDPAGRLFDLSDRPLMCSSYDGHNEIVFGSADHALYALDLSAPRRGPTKLYSKRWGHTDWVTSCTHLTNGRVLSCGMDKICLWSADKRRCQDLYHHNRSISAVAAGANDIAYSASYDCTIAVWNLSGGERATDNTKPVDVWSGHKSPIIELKVNRDLVASGGKDGGLLCWDTTSGNLLIRTRAHEASITALLLPENTHGNVISGGSDGNIKVWDVRSKNLLASNICHTNKNDGSFAPVAGIACIGEHILVSGGANSTVVITDQRHNGIVATFNYCNNGVYSVKSAPDNKSVFVGDGEGMVFCYNAIEAKLCYGLGASSSGAVRCIEPVPGKSEIVTGAEDGKVLRFEFA